MGAAAAAVDTRPRPGPAPCGVRSGDGQAQRRPAPHWIAAAGTRSGSDSSWRAAMPDATRAQPAAHRQLVGLLRSRGASALHCKTWLAAAAWGAAAGHAQAASRTRPQRSCGQIDVGPGGQAPRAPMGAGFGAAPLTPSTAPFEHQEGPQVGAAAHPLWLLPGPAGTWRQVLPLRCALFFDLRASAQRHV